MEFVRLLTKEEKKFYEKKLKALQDDDDYEASHDRADDLLCKALHKMGYHKITKIFESLHKWYA